MDNVTHTLFAVSLGRTPLGRAGRGTTAALVVASNAPDIDAIAGLRSGISYLTWHRGPTHGLLGILGLGVGTAAIVWSVRRAIDRAGMRSPDQPANASFAMLCAVSIIATLFHVLMDLPTSYGTRVLSPFAWHWFAVDWMPIIDVYLLTILIGGAFAGLVSEPSRRRNQAIVFTLMATVYGVRAIAHREALEIAPELFGRALPPRCDPEAPIDAGLVRWPRDAHARARPGDKRCLVDMAALPTFISPFRWTIVAQFSNAYELHDVDLLDSRLQQPATPIERFLRLTIRYPDVWLPVVHVAAQTALAQRFLGFSRFPAARSAVDERTGVTTVRWTDMRFVRAPLTQAARRGNLFTATIRIDRDGHVVDEHLGP